ncbi:MAG: hypothetical protein WA865_19525 [Spirulinaceae cyanobacterium]
MSLTKVLYEVNLPIIAHNPQQDDLNEEDTELLEQMSLLLGDELENPLGEDISLGDSQ